MTLSSSAIRPSSRRRVVAEQRGQARLGVQDATEPEQLLLDLVDLVLDLGTLQQRQPGQVLDAVDEVGLRGPPLGRSRPQQLRRVCSSTLPENSRSTRRTFASESSVGSARCLVRRRLGDEQSDHRSRVRRPAWSDPGASSLPATSSNSLVSAVEGVRGWRHEAEPRRPSRWSPIDGAI